MEMWSSRALEARCRRVDIEVWGSSGSMQACGRGGIEVWNARGPAAGVATMRCGGMELWRLGALKACRRRVDAEAERYGALWVLEALWRCRDVETRTHRSI